MQHTIARIFVDEALDCGRAAGIDVAAMLAELRIAEDRLDHLSDLDFGRIWLDLSLRMEDEMFGFAKRPMRPGSTTLLGHAITGAPTVEVGVKRAVRFLRVVLDEPYGVVTRDGDLCAITMVEHGQSRSAFTYRAFFLVLHGYTCWLAQDRVPLTSLSFPCKEPEQINDYGHFFGIPVQFEAAEARLTFPWRYMTRPVNRTQKDLKRFLRAAPANFVRGYRDTETLQHQIVNLFLSRTGQDWPDMREAAAALGMSRSTLHRRLAQTGQTFGALKEELRRSQSAQMLNRSDAPVAMIAANLGYAEESAFYRAFQRWYGLTPTAYRREVRRADGGVIAPQIPSK